jgi:Domain of unknown function (DUF4262)
MMTQQRDEHAHQHDQEGIEAMVRYQGFALFHGRAAARGGWTHTIGLYDPASGRPELFICGLTTALRVHWLLDLGLQMKGPPSREALQEEARGRGIPIAELGYPPGGRVFEPGRIYRLAQGDLPGCFGRVEPRYYEEYLWHACAYHGHAGFAALQYVFSDPAGRFPWREDCDPRTRRAQVVLFDPQQDLPLLEEEA